MAYNPVSKTLLPWLKANLGKSCLAPLTSTDAAALASAVHLVELYGYCDAKDERPLMQAFGHVVRAMQPKCRHLAYHAIAHVSEWHARDRVWAAAGLDPLENPGVCEGEPGASRPYEEVAA